MIYIRTFAYNAEKTLRRAIDSILNQTYSNFEYWILDNGSKDRTREIIREYAQKDKRIVPYFSKVNMSLDENQEFWLLPHHIPEGDHFCILDADDWYELTFLEDMLHFVKHNQLDVAACGTRFIAADNGELVGERVLPQDVVIREASDYDRYFSVIHWNLRQVWGKLYSSRAAKARYEIDSPDWFPKAYGGDTINVLETLMEARSTGVLAKPLHNYSVSQKSVSYKWIPGRIEADVILYEKTIEFLTQKCGHISKQNQQFMYGVYYHSIKDTVPVLMNSDLSKEDKLAGLEQIFSHPITIRTWEADLSQIGISMDDKAMWLDTILTWTLPLYKGKRKTRILLMAQNMAALAQDEPQYIRLSKELIKQYISNGNYTQARNELEEWETLLPQDDELKLLRRKVSF